MPARLPFRRRLPVPCTALLLALAAPASPALERITLEAAGASLAGVRAQDVRATLDLTAAAPRATVQVAKVHLGEPVGALQRVSVDCDELIVREPRFACGAGRLAARGGPTGAVASPMRIEYDSEAGTLDVQLTRIAVAGSPARVAGRLDRRGWTLSGSAPGASIPELRGLAAAWVSLPEAYAIDGRIDLEIEATGRGGDLRLELESRSARIDFTNAEGTIVGERLAAALRATAVRTARGVSFEALLQSDAGQALAGAVLFDFAANPLDLAASGALEGEALTVRSLELRQRDLLEASGAARVRLGRPPALESARVSVQSLQFPAAYTSFLQIALAATDLGALATSGRVRGAAEIAANRIVRLDATLEDVGFEDTRGKFAMAGIAGDIHWAAGEGAPVAASHLEWRRGSAYGLSGGEARLAFRARDRGFELLGETRLPVFDGGVVVRELTARRLGQPDAELDFDATIEPISMPLLSRAFGWPQLQGQLAGRIPGLTYRNGMLAVEGDITANVFDGTIVGSGFRLRDPLGPWPRLYASFTARRLDLELVTRTFPIGTITGRLDADIKGLELFDWSPVAFDARLYSTPGDRSRRRISQRAVTSISSIGGGGGGVTAALQSGVLRFFDEFRYDRIGIRCQLRNDVCLMSGIERGGGSAAGADSSYYIVRGAGLPRIDIIGNAGRVDWPRLVGQVGAAMKGAGPLTR